MPKDRLKTICIDETLISCRNKCSLIIYEPNKSDSYVSRSEQMTDCETGLLLSFFLCDIGVNGAETVTMVDACKRLM